MTTKTSVEIAKPWRKFTAKDPLYEISGQTPDYVAIFDEFQGAVADPWGRPFDTSGTVVYSDVGDVGQSELAVGRGFTVENNPDGYRFVLCLVLGMS